MTQTEFREITVEIDGRGVARLTLDRPEKHNALSARMMDELHAAARELGADPAVRAVVLTGAGESFCAGGDLAWMREQMAADGATRRREARRLADMLGALDRMPKPLIGRVQGQAFGGGMGLISVCDLAIGAEGARFGFTETRLGLIPATIGPYVVARMGAGGARQVFMSARLFDAARAVDLGLLARACAAEDLDAAVEAEAAAYLACAPGAVAEAKALIADLARPIVPDAVDRSIEALARRWESAEAEEGTAAFFARRKPEWAR